MKRTMKLTSVFMTALMIMSCFVFSSYANNDLEKQTDDVVQFSHGGLLESSPEFYEVGQKDDNFADVINERDGITLPSAVDFSNINSPYNQYLPAIGNQYLTNACAAFATAYYQFTFEANKYEGIPTTPQNTYCPQFLYSIIQFGYNNGSTYEDAYKALGELGCLKYSDYSNNACYANDYEFLKYNSDNTTAKINALKLRATLNTINVGTFNGQVIDLNNNSTNLDALDIVKAALSEGKILTTEVRYLDSNELNYFIASNYSPYLANYPDSFVASSNRNAYAMVYTPASTLPDIPAPPRHAMAIIGYDDNFWVDLNENNQQDPGELGAFKLIDSYGTQADYHDNGCIWVMYDALNSTSCCPNSNYTSQNRIPTFQIYNEVVPFYEIEVSHKDIKMIAKINITTRTPRSLLTKSQMGSDGWNVYPAYHLYNEVTQEFVYPNVQYETICDRILSNSPTTPFTGDLILDLSDCFGHFTSDMYTYFAQLKFYAPYAAVTINSATIIDDMQNCISIYGNCPLIMGSSETPIYSVHTLYKGDFNYDMSIDSSDYSILSSYLASSINLSSAQKFLADINGDGIINIKDLKILKLIVNGLYNDSLTYDENLEAYDNLFIE